MNKPIVKIDIDGVIRDLFSAVCELYNNEFDTNITEVDDYDVDISFPLIRERYNMSAFDWFFKVHAVECFRYSNPFPKAAEAIKLLRDNGFKVVIATWQFNVHNKIDTLEFLEDCCIEYDDICFTKDKWMIHCDWIIDDNPEFLNEWRETGRKVMITAPYNRNVTGYRRAESLYSAAHMIISSYKNDI